MSTVRPDLRPAAATTGGVVAGIRDDQLDAVTPSEGYRVGDLLEHVEGLARGLRLTARKEEVPLADLRVGDAALLRPGWRERVPAALADLAGAWAEPGAWEGDTVQGGVRVPAARSGMFVLVELLVHGWELARATGQPYATDEVGTVVALTFFAGFSRTAAADAVFGPVVRVLDDAPALDRLLGLTGRDPGWAPPAAG